MEFGFPELTDSFLAGQDIFYEQFNDAEFYVEDTEQEHLYLNILKQLFPEITIGKIFPLNGKTNLKNHAKINTEDKSKIYIADLDFDKILGTKEDIANVFYLNKYSIENFLINKDGIYELIREKSPKLKDSDIDDLINFNTLTNNCKRLLSELSCSFLVIQKFSLGKEYFGLNPPRDFDLDSNPPCYRNAFILNYFRETENLLKNKDGRYTLKSKQQEYKKYFRSVHNALINIPGKYLLNLLKYNLEKLKVINQLSLESFTYKLSKECCTNQLQYLKQEIIDYRK
jgi:hypothetical protein